MNNIKYSNSIIGNKRWLNGKFRVQFPTIFGVLSNNKEQNY